MANELAMLKEQSGKNNASNGKTKRPARRFQSAEVGSDCCVFIKVWIDEFELTLFELWE